MPDTVTNFDLRLVVEVGRETSCFEDAMCTCELIGVFHVSIIRTVSRRLIQIYYYKVSRSPSANNYFCLDCRSSAPFNYVACLPALNLIANVGRARAFQLIVQISVNPKAQQEQLLATFENQSANDQN